MGDGLTRPHTRPTLTMIARHIAWTLLFCHLAAGCVVNEPGIEVEVSVTLDDEDVVRTSDQPLLVIQNNLDYTIELHTGSVAFSSVRLIACGASPIGALNTGELRTTGQAHTLSSGVRSGEPVVLDLLNDDPVGTPLGLLRPPPGQYCSLEMEVLPADDDARDLPGQFMVGQTLRLLGRWTDAHGQRTRPFAINAPISDRAAIPLSLNGPLTLERPGQPIDVTINLPMDLLFADVDFANMENEEVVDLFMANLLSTMTRR